jgi:hypothetical protein
MSPEGRGGGSGQFPGRLYPVRQRSVWLASLAKDFEAVVIEDNPCDAELTLRALEWGAWPAR